MSVSGKRNVKKIAAAVALSAAFGAAAGYILMDDPAPETSSTPTTDTADNTATEQPVKSVDQGPEDVEGPACVYLDKKSRDFFGADSEQEQKLLGYFDEASRSETGRDVLQVAEGDYTQACYTEHLNHEDPCGSMTAGSYSHFMDMIILNPNPKFDGAMMPMIIVHETRHKQQVERVGNFGLAVGNFKGADYMIMHWLQEADARLTTIVAAYELEQQGQPQYMQALKDFGGHDHMIEAFSQSLSEQPDNMAEAMRAAIRAVRNNKVLARKYDNGILEFLESRNFQFMPHMPVDELVTDDKLLKLVEIGDYTNYMDEELISFIRNSVTDEDFQNLSDIRKEAGGTKGAACIAKKQGSPTPS